ncbi:MAG: thiamine-phosphate pyrophosphorylase [Helicobacter sp.]|nr:thiamine-phosphate pyrophosphorylase [Helicobacter sp.]
MLSSSTLRIIDANINRLREGIRVIEDILRYALNHKEFALKLKNIRHNCKISLERELLASRDSTHDVLNISTPKEMERKNLQNILQANFKRTQESTRTLEETLKLLHPQESQKFKAIRYELYTLEKEIFTLPLESLES